MRLLFTIIIAFLMQSKWVYMETNTEQVESATIIADLNENSATNSPAVASSQNVPESIDTNISESKDQTDNVQQSPAEQLNKLANLEKHTESVEVLFTVLVTLLVHV